MVYGVRIGGDRDQYALFLREHAVAVIQVEPVRIGVELKRGIVFFRLGHDLREVYEVWLPLAQKSARRMSDDVYEPGPYCLYDSLGHLLHAHAETRVY